MCDGILIAIGGLPVSEKSLVAAVGLAAHYKADPTAIGVVEVRAVGIVGKADELRQNAEAQMRQIGEASVEFAHSRDVALGSVVVRGDATEAIVRYAESEGIKLVVIGQHGHSRIARFFLARTSRRMSEQSPCSVMIVK